MKLQEVVEDTNEAHGDGGTEAKAYGRYPRYLGETMPRNQRRGENLSRGKKFGEEANDEGDVEREGKSRSGGTEGRSCY